MNISGINCFVAQSKLHYMGRLNFFDIKTFDATNHQGLKPTHALYADSFYVKANANSRHQTSLN